MFFSRLIARIVDDFIVEQEVKRWFGLNNSLSAEIQKVIFPATYVGIMQR